MFAMMRLKQRAVEFAAETPLHGPAQLLDGGSGRRWLYAVLISLSLVGFGYQACVSLVAYNGGYPAPATSYSVSNTGKTIIPAFDVCLPARFHKGRLAAHALDAEVVELLHLSFLSSLLKSVSMYYHGEYLRTEVHDRLGVYMQAEARLAKHLSQLGMDLDTFIGTTSFQCTDFLQWWFDVESVASGKQGCNQTKSVRTHLGHCTRFPGSEQISELTGSARIYRFVIPVEEYAAGFYTPLKGIQLLFNDGEDSELRAIPIPLDAKTEIEIKLTKKKFINYPGQRCEPVRHSSKTRAYCMYQCITRQMFPDDCPCQPYEYKLNSTKETCTVVGIISCFAHEIKELEWNQEVEELMMRALVACNDACPHYCEQHVYDVALRTIPLVCDFF